jgi:lycopene cyclase domain-containing protein
VLNLEKAYTTYIFSLLILVLSLSFFDKTNVINSFYFTFLVILVPFIAVNAILTGSFIDEPVVWYNNYENIGIRFLTIPVEDFGYAFSLILFNLLLRNKLKKD